MSEIEFRITAKVEVINAQEVILVVLCAGRTVIVSDSQEHKDGEAGKAVTGSSTPVAHSVPGHIMVDEAAHSIVVAM